MKKFLSILFVFAGIFISHSAFSQTTTDTIHPKKDNKSSEKKTDSKPSGNNGDIMIDEGGTPKTKGKKPATKTSDGNINTPKTEEKKEDQASEKTAAPASAAPDIAIDEGGSPKEKNKPAKVENPSSSSSADSSMVNPAQGVERPH